MRRLKRQKTIPEKDAKAIFMQIMSGLRCAGCVLLCLRLSFPTRILRAH